MFLIAITVTIIYSNIYHAPFVFDDTKKIIENERIRDLNYYFAFEQIIKPRNVVFLTFAINYKINGLNVAGYHIANILIHTINGFLVYFLALVIFKKLNRTLTCPDSTPGLSPFYKRSLTCSEISLMSLFAALIFVTHPIQTQAVTYTVQRMASMAAMFYLSSVLFYLKARTVAQATKYKAQRRASLTFYILSAFCGILALLSKQHAASLPGAILLAEYLLINRTWQDWKKTIPWFTFSFTLWAISVSYVLGLFSNEINSINLLEDISGLTRAEQVSTTLSRWEYLCTQFNVLVIYIRLIFLPIHQCVDYLYPYKNGFWDGYTPLAVSFLMGLAVISVWSIRKLPILSLAFFWFFITISVESSIIPLYAYFEHRLYLPMFGFAIFASWLLFCFFQSKKPLVFAAYAIIIFSYGTATYQRNKVWQDEIKLWSDTVSKSPQNHRAYASLGNAFLLQDMLEEAVFNYNEALRIRPDYGETHSNLGFALMQQDKIEDAILHYEMALRIVPKKSKIHYNLGIALKKKGDINGAVTHFSEVIRANPNHYKAYFNLGITLKVKGDIEGAVTHFNEAIQINPDFADSHYMLGISLIENSRLKEAITHFSKAIQLNPNYAEAHMNLANILSQQGNLEEAVFHYEEALQIKPNDAMTHSNLGNALTWQKKFEDAISHCKEAIRIEPNHANAHSNLGNVYVRQGRLDEAIFHYKEALRNKPNDAMIHNNMGNALLQQRRYEEAVYHCEEALRIKPDYANAQQNLGFALKGIDNKLKLSK